MATTLSSPSIRVGDRRIPVILPNRRDPRLHTAAVIISIHIIGITALGFRVSVPQILSAIVTAALIDVVLTYRATKRLVWPASAMLTGSGVGLILRLVGMQPGDHWTGRGWHYFALVSGISVLTKYLIRFRGEHVFNPSNVGLVAAFLVVGSSVIEPLDFWWAPLGPWMIVAYLVIVGGGIAITWRLALTEMAVTFWVVLAAGLGVLAASGHCMTAAWSVTPVCDLRFWTVLVTSPEILVFLFFMITDPKTAPRGRLARVGFAATLALVATLLIAPQTFEFGAKVGLLGSLVIWSPLRGLFDRLLPDPAPTQTGLGGLIHRVLDQDRRPTALLWRGAVAGSALVVAAASIVLAGVPAQAPVHAAPAPDTEIVVEVDPASLPEMEVDPGVHSLALEVDDVFVEELAVTLAENLLIEAEAIRRGDTGVLLQADGGSRLLEMQDRVGDAIAAGERVVWLYRFDSLALRVAEVEGQSGAGLVVDGTGTVEEVTYDARNVEQARAQSQFELSFMLRPLGPDGRWVIVEVTEVGA